MLFSSRANRTAGPPRGRVCQWSLVIVVAEPSPQSASPLLSYPIDSGVGPAAQQGLDEPLPLRSCAACMAWREVLEIEHLTGERVYRRPVGAAFVGHAALHGGAVGSEEGNRPRRNATAVAAVSSANTRHRPDQRRRLVV